LYRGRNSAVRTDRFAFVVKGPSRWIGVKGEDALRRRRYGNGRHETQVLAQYAVDSLVTKVRSAGSHSARATEAREHGGTQHGLPSTTQTNAAATADGLHGEVARVLPGIPDTGLRDVTQYSNFLKKI
jgi:hypothetical protein